ncbi:hypothetical protein [Fusobacterium ulcerans]|uniref:hypothetical protein n=1 Tax=Fusobacterium ulcerans TaxID=861 RepID=UPI00241FB5E7|nr:hypothetical protein [Fusobacterium ulcerans]
MKKVFILISSLLFFYSCGKLPILQQPKKDYSLIENQIKDRKIIIKDNKIFYKDSFDIMTSSKEEIELLKDYAEVNHLILTPIN